MNNGTFRFIGSNSLKFIRTDNLGESQNDFNRIYGEITYKNKFFIPYVQKVQQTDNLWFQFRTNYPAFSFYLVDESGIETSLSYSQVLPLDDGKVYYNIHIDTSLLDGCYYVRMYAPGDEESVILNFRSNNFEVRSSFDYTSIIYWNGNSAYDDGMEWDDEMQELRIEATLIDDVSGAEITSTRDSNENIEKLNFAPIYKKKLQVEMCSFEIAHLLNRIIGHDTIVINDLVFNGDNSFDFGERMGNTQMYMPSIELELKDYENYSEDDVLVGDNPVIPTKALRFSTGKALRFSVGKAVRYQ